MSTKGKRFLAPPEQSVKIVKQGERIVKQDKRKQSKYNALFVRNICRKMLSKKRS